MNPASTLSNSFGSSAISCGTSCVLNVSQGGCNTADQIAHFFTSQYANTFLYAHFTDYTCWNSANRSLSSGGNCCAQAVSGMSGTTKPKLTASLYPNPANKEVWIESPTEQKFTLSTTGGQWVSAGKLESGRSALDIAALTTGLYLIKLEESGQVLKLHVKP